MSVVMVAHFRVVPVPGSDCFPYSVIKITSIDKHTMKVRIIISLVAVHAPTEMSKPKEREMFDAKLN